MAANLSTMLLFKAKDEVTPVAVQVESSVSGVEQVTNKMSAAFQASQGASGNAAVGLEEVAAGGKRTEESLRGLVHTGNIAGIGFRDMRHVMTGAMFGIETGLMAVGEHADATTKKTLSMVQGFAHVALAAAFFGPIGAAATAAGLGIGALVGASEELKNKLTELQQPFAEVRKELEAMAKLKGTEKFATELGVTVAGLKAYIAGTEEAYNKAQTLNALHEQMVVSEHKIADAQERLAHATSTSVLTFEQESQTFVTWISHFGQMGAVVNEFNDTIYDETANLAKYKSAIDALSPSMRQLAQDTEETDRVTTGYSKGLISSVEEHRRYTDELDKLSREHRKRQETFKVDQSNLEVKGLAELLKNRTTLQRELEKKDAEDRRREETYAREDERRQQEQQLAALKLEQSFNLEKLRLTQTLLREEERDRITHANSLQDLEERRFMELRGAHTEKERADIELRVGLERARIERDTAQRLKEQQESAKLRLEEIENRHKERLADFEEQRRIAEQTTTENREVARENARAQKDLVVENSKIQREEIVARLQLEREALTTRIKEEKEAHTESIAQATKTFKHAIKGYFDIETEQEKVNRAILELSPAWDPAIAKALTYKGIITSLSTSLFVPSESHGTSGFAMGGTVPGAYGQPQMAIVHGGEQIVPPGGMQETGSGNVFNFYAPIYGVSELENEIRRIAHLLDQGK